MRRIFSLFGRPSSLGSVTSLAFAPLAQAERCLDVWLAEEGRTMTARQRQRAAGLIARYFEHEDGVSDKLILSFLHHYSGMGVVDLEDPQAVRMELKAVLDRSSPHYAPAPASRLRLLLAAGTGMLAMASVLVVFYLSQQTLTAQEQHVLRATVAQQADARGVTPVTIWAEIKRDLDVPRYQEIRRWDFSRAMAVAKKQAP